MASQCTICRSKDRDEVNAALVAGHIPRAQLCAKYHFTQSSMHRHYHRHLPQALAKAHDAETVASADGLVGDIQGLRAKAERIGKEAERAGDGRLALQAVRELTRIVELLARMQGELHTGNTTNIVVAPEWLAIRGVIFSALAGFPEARTRVANELLQIEATAE
jgi:hypothetical protein